MKNNITWKAHLNQNYKNQNEKFKRKVGIWTQRYFFKNENKNKKEFEIGEKR